MRFEMERCFFMMVIVFYVRFKLMVIGVRASFQKAKSIPPNAANTAATQICPEAANCESKERNLIITALTQKSIARSLKARAFANCIYHTAPIYTPACPRVKAAIPPGLTVP